MEGTPDDNALAINDRKCLEDLPDEILLEICLYLNSFDIYYSFGHLNQRLQSVISEFYFQLDLSQISFDQFQFICSSSFIFFVSQHLTKLTLNNDKGPSQIEMFQEMIGHVGLKEKLPNLKSLTLLDFDNTNTNILSQILYVEELKITFSIYEKIQKSTEILLQKYIFGTENNFRKVILETDDGINLQLQIKPNIHIQDLTIRLVNFDDLLVLFTVVPNIVRLCFCITHDLSATLVPRVRFSSDILPKYLKTLLVNSEHKEAAPLLAVFLPVISS